MHLMQDDADVDPELDTHWPPTQLEQTDPSDEIWYFPEGQFEQLD